MRRTKEEVPMTRPPVGTAIEIAPGVRSILAPNSGPMTYWGTNSYILGETELAIIDPGPDDAGHISALLEATAQSSVTYILVTHAHADHSAAAGVLSAQTGAPVVAFGPPEAGRRDVMQRLSQESNLGGGEGLDHGFAPDICLREGDTLHGTGWELGVLHLPGHFAGQLGFQFGDILFSGDHVMDWASSIVSPPDGHLGDFLATSRKLIKLAPQLCLSGHGAPLRDPEERLEWLIDHRKNRELQILDVLSSEPLTISKIVDQVYLDLPRVARAAASRNVLAHLIDLWERSIVEAIPAIQQDAIFRLR
jgi:glyoxylase-like metal-dependent hydrolase (beta-lactamase superfamily II)